MSRLAPLLLLAALLTAAGPSHAAEPQEWGAIEAKARGQTVFFNAWGGDDRVNAHFAWIADRLQALYGVNLRHVKLNDTAEAVQRVLAEKTAGRHTGGSVDLIWINGENFLTMKQNGLLYGPFTQMLPNFTLVDTVGKPGTVMDFGLPTEGYESPMRMAQVVFVYDSARVKEVPRSMAAMLDWARATPGRTTYPQPPNFLGTTFLKQALYDLLADPSALLQPVETVDFEAVTAPLWSWLEQITPLLWREGKVYPKNGPAMRQMMSDGEIDIYISFNPAEASLAIANGQLPESVRTFTLARGTIGNASHVAIPFNARAREGALVAANFILSPENQARQQDPRVLGNMTVLDLDKLSAEDRRRFEMLPRGVATLPPEALEPQLPEPHASWIPRLEAAWQQRLSR